MISLYRTILVSGLLLLTFFPPRADGGNDEEGYKPINGTRLFYQVMGSGEPIVIVHGGPGLDHTYFLPQMAQLAKSYKLIFYDQRSSGRSSADVDSNSMTMDKFVEDLEGIRKAFNLDSMNLMGHSWGGLVAMFYAVKHPDHLRSLMLINSIPASASLRDSTFKILQEHMSRKDSLEQAAITSSVSFNDGDPATIAKYFRLLCRGSFYQKRFVDSLTLIFDSTYGVKSRNLRFLRKDPELQSYDLFDKLDTIACPVLIVAGDHDMVPPDFQDLIRKHIRNSRYVLFPDCGHFPFIEAQEEFFPTIAAFMASVGH